MARKPANILYGVDENPGFGALLLLAIQHICLLSIAFIFPVVIIGAIGGTPEQTQTLITMSMIATGLGTILQGLNRGPIGSGYFCPTLNGPAFLSASLLAGKAGGLPLIFGMTAAGAAFEALFSKVVIHLRAVFPAEVTGTIVMMVGIEIIPFAVTRFAGIDGTHPVPDMNAFVVAAITLAAMAGFNVWGKGPLRLYSVLIGIAIGYMISIGFGILTKENLQLFVRSPLFSFPSIDHYGMSFQWALLVPFLVATVSSALKTMGDLTTCQRINDADWKRPDMQSISRGILACAAGNFISGVSGALGQSVSSSNVGLSIATGATSRRIAYVTGGLLVLLAFFPMPAAIFAIMPTPVMGASLIFSASFMILAGMQIILTRLIDSRKIFVIGISIVFGLSVDILPGLYKNIHPWLQPFFSSSLSLATICAIFLNMIFRIGIVKKASLTLTPGVDSSTKIFDFMKTQGGTWGALRDVMIRASAAVNELLESVSNLNLSKGDLVMEARFDEFNLDIEVSYEGKPMIFSHTPPSKEDLLHDEKAFSRLSGFIIRSNVDRVQISHKNGRSLIRFHFDH